MLAAGAGTRFGGPKAPYLFDGERLVDRSVRTLREAGCAPVIVVLGAWRGDVPDAHVVVNSTWEDGMGSSLRCALEELSTQSDVQSAFVLLVDQPFITADGVRRVLAHPAPIVQAAYRGRPGHPVLFSRDHWRPLMATLDGDSGARDYLSEQDRDLVAVGDLCDDTDMDVQPSAT